MQFILLHHHVVNELVRQFAEHLKRKLPLPQIFKVVVLDKLYDISDCLIAMHVFESLAVGIEHFHLGEVTVSDADDDPAERHTGKRDKKVLRLLHIVALTIGYNDDYVVDSVCVQAILLQTVHY